LVQPVYYTKRVETNKIYKFRMQMIGGPTGWAKYWITYPGDATETLMTEVKGRNLMATATDDVLYDFAFFSGGASTAYSPEHDSYARNGGIRYWSGEEYWTADTGGNGGSGEGSGGDGLTITLEDRTYTATGDIKLEQK
jgi:hypothetical protein